MSRRDIPNSYISALGFLNGRDSRYVPGVRGTSINRINNDKIAMYYHNTPVVIWEPDMVTLNASSYYTYTTKQRINQGIKGSGYSVYQYKHQWYLHQMDGNVVIPFFNGMKV
ncbi:MAG: hypothetical protein EB127_05520 [Alphaproteobacteria bacterium]|nr:hypothetical protein [Alphaproteobacteria bacterium]